MTAYENLTLGKLVESLSFDEDFDHIGQDEMEEKRSFCRKLEIISFVVQQRQE
ncbi:hypothetical protein Hanom_Chr08g00722461 [Helianthus anomalus]